MDAGLSENEMPRSGVLCSLIRKRYLFAFERIQLTLGSSGTLVVIGHMMKVAVRQSFNVSLAKSDPARTTKLFMVSSVMNVSRTSALEKGTFKIFLDYNPTVHSSLKNH